ncbi:SMP-30/gluconolactonase/LRE family protein [Ewingella sp. S1.OA.A_B6]
MDFSTLPDIFAPVQACLGESPVWDKRTGTLFFIDITRGEIFAIQGNQPPLLIYRSVYRVGSLALTTRGDLIFTEDACVILFCLSSGKITARSNVASDGKSFRYNDSACDPQGRLVTGLMDEQHSVGSGSLHCFGNKLERNNLISDLGLPNGIAWCESGRSMYYVDSVARIIFKAGWCKERGQLFNPRVFAETPEHLGRPDGIALDRADNLWVCQFNGGCILQYSATGTLLLKVDLPVPRPTSCCFGGKGLSMLYITSAKFGMTEEEIRRFPQSGDIFQLSVRVPGLETHCFDDRLFHPQTFPTAPNTSLP